VRHIIFGDDETTRRVLIETVDDARAETSTDTREIPTVVEKGIDYGAVWITRSWVNHHPRFFVDDDHIFILIEYF
jgi:hypothetical protein